MNKKIICEICECDNKNNHIHCCKCGNQLPIQEVSKENKFFLFIKYLGNIITGFIESTFNNLYLIFLILSIIYFIYYLIISNSGTHLVFFNANLKTLTLLKEISLIIFSAGIFTSSLKYLQYIKVFEKEFERIFASSNFTQKVKESVESITFSREFLQKQNNLEKIWQRVTLTMYEKQFPQLYGQLKNIIKNELFKQNNISFYYKNFKLDYYISREEGSDKIKIEEITTYNLIRPDRKLFEWNFKVAIEKTDSNNDEYPKISIDFIDNDELVFDSEKDIEIIPNEENTIKEVKKKINGQTNYLIKRHIEIYQDLNKDREYSFGSDRIIEDLDITIHTDNFINAIFSESWKVKFINENTRESNKKSYIYRGLLLPGEKFKLFFIKPS